MFQGLPTITVKSIRFISHEQCILLWISRCPAILCPCYDKTLDSCQYCLINNFWHIACFAETSGNAAHYYFHGLSILLIAALDLDECSSRLHTCAANASCSNIVGSYTCKCIAGYTGTGMICSGEDFLLIYSVEHNYRHEGDNLSSTGILATSNCEEQLVRSDVGMYFLIWRDSMPCIFAWLVSLRVSRSAYYNG